MPELTEWEAFYLIVGGAAGALIGLQFVVMTLVAESPPMRVHDAGKAFSTPTVVHFAAALLLAALAMAPWHGTSLIGALWGAVGGAGTVYQLIVGRRMRGQEAYRPVIEDWLCHLVLPLLGYLGLIAAAILVSGHRHEALYAAGAAALLLLFIGIHNSWDAISFHVFVSRGAKDRDA